MWPRSRKQTAGHNHNIKRADKYFENMAKVQISDNESNKSKLHAQIN